MNSRHLRGRAFAAIFGLVVTPLALSAAEKKPDITVDWGNGNAPRATQPVPPPDPLDPRYDREGLLTAFRAVAKQLNVSIERVAVDTSEYPFLVYGVLEGRRTHHDLRGVLEKMPSYAYSGSTTLVRGNDTTYFVLNMNPPRSYPPERRAAISERLGPRLRALLDKVLGR